MPKIIVLNVGTEHALGEHSSRTHPINRSGWRHAWFAEEGDIIVSPVGIDAEFMRYIAETFGWDEGKVSVLSRDRLVTDEFLLSAEVIEELTRLISFPSSWTIMPCFATAGVAELASLLGIGGGTDSGFALQSGSDLLNRKTHFRQLGSAINLPLAEGSVARSPHALAAAVERHLPVTGTVIVKQDNGAGGLGNVTLTNASPTPLPGSRETRLVDRNVKNLAEEVWSELYDESSHGLVVESYHSADHLFYLEYFIGEDRVPEFVDSGTIRYCANSDPEATDLIWLGLDVPAENPPWLTANALSHGMRMASLIARLGYRGYFNIDGISTVDGQLIFNEVNARWGGGLVGHSICERLLGKRYADTRVFSTLRNLRPAPLATVHAALRERRLAFTRTTGEGVLVLACDPMLINSMECLVIGTTRERVRVIEEELRQAVHGA